MPDLREGGKYAVVDYDEKIARTLSNGEQLIEQYVSAFKQLLQFESNAVSRILRADCTLNGTAVAYRTGKFDWAIEDKLTGITLDPNLIKETPYEPCGPYFTYDYHSGDRKAKTAMQRMFLLQVPLNKQGDGRLLAADLDHAGVSN